MASRTGETATAVQVLHGTGEPVTPIAWATRLFGAKLGLPLYAPAVLLGAIAGTTFGIRFAAPMVLKALGLVLVIAGLKLIGENTPPWHAIWETSASRIGPLVASDGRVRLLRLAAPASCRTTIRSRLTRQIRR